MSKLTNRFDASHFCFSQVNTTLGTKSEIMKKSALIAICFSFLASSFFAQADATGSAAKFTLGIFGGINIPNLSDGSNNPLSSGYTSRLGGTTGLTTSWSLGSNFALRIDVLYSSEGGQRNGVQAMDASSFNPQAPEGSYVYATYKNESILNYLEVPVLLKYTIPISSSSTFYVDFGPYAGILINARQKTSGTSLIYADKEETMPMEPVAQSFNATTDVSSSIKSFNFGLTGGAGFAQKAGPGCILLDLRGAYGLSTVQQHSQDGSSHNGYLAVTLGYSIPL
jgi:hypothetical protein